MSYPLQITKKIIIYYLFSSFIAAGCAMPKKSSKNVQVIKIQRKENASNIRKKAKLAKKKQREKEDKKKKQEEERKGTLKKATATNKDDNTVKMPPNIKKAIDLFNKFIEKKQGNADSDLLADTYLKIAELYFKGEELRYEKAMKQYDEIIEKAGFKDLSEMILPPSYDFTKAIEYYKIVLEKFPKYKKLDATYYGLAYCYYEQNQKELAQTIFKKLNKKFPDSIFTLESMMRIGEYFFTINQFEEAAQVFREMLKKKHNPYYNVVLYKLGWTYFSEGNFSDAIATFLSIKQEDSTGKTTPISRGLLHEAMRYVARIYSGTSGQRGLIADLKNSPKGAYLPLLVRFLGDSYKEEGNYNDAKDAYKKYLSMYPTNNAVPIVEYSIIQINEKTGKREAHQADLQKFVDKYNISGKWFTNVKDKDIKGEVLTKVKIAQATIALYSRSIYNLFVIIDEVTGLDDAKQVQQYLTSGQRTRIRELCYKNIATIYSNSTGVEGLMNYIAEKASYRIHVKGLLKSIASAYEKSRRQWQAVQAYQMLLEKYPRIEDAPIIQNKIVRLYEEANDPEKAMEERKVYIAKFNPDGDWYSSDRINADRRWGSIALAEKSLRTIVLYHHANAQKYKKKEDIEEAIAYYKKYLDFFPDHSRNLEMTFLLAELFNEFKDPLEAIPYYERVAWVQESVSDEKKSEKILKREKKRKKYKEDAAYAIILIYETLRKKENYFSPNTEALIETIKKLVEHFPDNKRAPELLFKAGEIFFKLGRYNRAQKFFIKLVDKYPSLTISAEAIRLVAQGYFELGEYEKAESWYVNALTSASKDDTTGKSTEPLKKMLTSAKFKKAEKLQADGKLLESGKEFLAISKISTDPLVASIALFNAGINFKKQEECEMLFDVNSRLLNKYSRSKYSKGVMLSYLDCENKKKNWVNGANNIVRFTRQHPYLPQLAESLFMAAEYYKKAGEIEKSSNTYILFAKIFSGDPKVIEAYSYAGDFEYNKGNMTVAEKYFQQSYKYFTKLKDGGNDINTFHAAKSKFMQGEIHFKRFKDIQIREPVEKTMTEKKNLMETLLAEYSETANFKHTEWTTAATYRIGMVFEEFKNSLINSERPKGLTTEELEDYDILLEDQAFPFEDKAIEAYQANINRLYKDHIYNEWIENTITRLADIFPWSYNKKEDIIRDGTMYMALEGF